MGMSLKIDDGLSHQLSPALDEPITLDYLSSWREDISMGGYKGGYWDRIRMEW